MTPEKLTRDDMRAAFAELDIEIPSLNQLKELRKEINEQMKASDCYHGTFRMRNTKDEYLTCKCDQWENREAVSFNRDGFVGFAGWADEGNVQPILRGFQKWVEDLSEYENFPCNELAN